MTVTLALAKQHLRILHDEEDTLISSYMAAAVAWVENYTGKFLTRKEATQVEAEFGSFLTLFYGPSPATLSIAYTDADDAGQTIPDAKIVRDRVYPGSTWPTIADDTPITLTYQAGYEATPADLDHAVLLLVGEYYDNREAGEAATAVTAAVESLCRPYRSLRV